MWRPVMEVMLMLLLLLLLLLKVVVMRDVLLSLVLQMVLLLMLMLLLLLLLLLLVIVDLTRGRQFVFPPDGIRFCRQRDERGLKKQNKESSEREKNCCKKLQPFPVD